MTADRRLNFVMDAKNVDLEHLPISDDTIDLGGKLNAKGHLSGTLTAPFFDGEVSSEKITVNGEALTELEGTLASNGRDKNKLNASFKHLIVTILSITAYTVQTLILTLYSIILRARWKIFGAISAACCVWHVRITILTA